MKRPPFFGAVGEDVVTSLPVSGRHCDPPKERPRRLVALPDPGQVPEQAAAKVLAVRQTQVQSLCFSSLVHTSHPEWTRRI